MAVLSYAELIDNIQTFINDNSNNEVSPADIRNNFIDVVDTMFEIGATLDGDLSAIADVSSTGMLVRTSHETWTTRTITGTTGQITVANGSGAGGNPTLSLPSLVEIAYGIQLSGSQFTIEGGNNINLYVTGDSELIVPTGSHEIAVLDDNGNIAVEYVTLGSGERAIVDFLDIPLGGLVVDTDSNHIFQGFNYFDVPVQGGMPIFARNYRPVDYVDGRWYDGGGSGVAPIAMSADKLIVTPFIVPHTWLPTQIALYCHSRTGTISARLGIYKPTLADNSPEGAELVVESGVISVNADTTLFPATIAPTLHPGLYWLAVVSNGTINVNYLLGSDLCASLGKTTASQANGSFYMDHTFGALPSDYAIDGDQDGCLQIMLRKT